MASQSQLMAESPYTFQWAATVLPQNCAYAWGIWTEFKTWFLGPTSVNVINGTTISSAIFAGLTRGRER